MLYLRMVKEHTIRPNTTELLPLADYDLFIVSFSGGKDSLACFLDLLDRGVPKSKIELWHQHVDGAPGSAHFMDWPVTEAYCRAVAKAFDVPIRFQWKEGGFEGEMLRKDSLTNPCRFEMRDGTIGQAGGIRGKKSTRMKFPQTSADLSVRWCSSYLKIDVAAMALNNDPTLKGSKDRQMKICFVTGERRQESAARSRYAEFEAHRCSTKARRVDQWRSVIDWDEGRVWAIIQKYGVRPHPAYYLGFSRVSCMLCIFGNKHQWATVRKIATDSFNKVAEYERQFGCTIKRGESVVKQANDGISYLATSDSALIEISTGTAYPVESVFVPEGQWASPSGAFGASGGPS